MLGIDVFCDSRAPINHINYYREYQSFNNKLNHTRRTLLRPLISAATPESPTPKSEPQQDRPSSPAALEG